MADRLVEQGAGVMTFRKTGMRHRAAGLSATFLALALLFYALSPVATLLSVANGLRHEDVATLRGALDWHAVRLGLKADLGGGLPVSLASAKVPAAADDELPGFGESFASTLVSHVVDDEVTPERMMAMLSGSGAGATGQGDAGALASVRSVLGRVERVAFLGPARFEAAIRLSDDPSAQPVCVSMRLERWQWKITQIHLPERMLRGSALVQDASRT